MFEQKNTGKMIGYIMQVIGQIQIPVTLINTVLLIITTSSVLQDRGIMIPVWLMGVIAFGIILSAGILAWKFSLPSFFASWNDQWYVHSNPLREDIELIKKKLNIEDEK